MDSGNYRGGALCFVLIFKRSDLRGLALCENPMAHRPPNIILIITDQQRFDTIGAHGYPFVETPVLDRLATEGTSFTHAFTCGASCVPARASLFSGQFPHTIGVLRNSDAWQHSWVERLNEGDYHCVNIGKMHTVPFDAPCGFHERYIVENKERRSDFGGRSYIDLLDVVLSTHDVSRPYLGGDSGPLDFRSRDDFADALGAFEWPLAPELHSDFFVGNLARWWLREHRRRRNSSKPLFLQIGFPGPHPPYDPLPEYLDRYRDKDLPLPQLDEAELASQPKAFVQLREKMVLQKPDSIAHQVRPSREAAHRQRAAYYANVSMIDTKVGEVLETLDAEGYLDDAVVIFTSDHGDVLSEHGQCTKWTMYEPSVRVPLIFWGKGRVASGARHDGLVQLMDVGPTVLALAGVGRPAGMEAVSLLDAIEGKPFEGRSHAYCEHGRDALLEGTSLVTMVRSRRWKLVHFTDSDDGQLFDLELDPTEMHNLWFDPGAAAEKKELLQQLLRWRLEGSVQSKDWCAPLR